MTTRPLPCRQVLPRLCPARSQGQARAREQRRRRTGRLQGVLCACRRGFNALLPGSAHPATRVRADHSDDVCAQASSSAPAAIHFGLLRLEGRFLLITVQPEDSGGVKRARALVHSRAVGANFAHQASVTIARPDELALGTVRSKLRLDSGSAPSSLPPSPNPGAGGLASPSFSHNTQAAAGRSPLRSYFPGHSPKLSQHPNGPHGQHVYNAQASPRLVSDPVRNGQQLSDDAPPPIPVKEGADL